MKKPGIHLSFACHGVSLPGQKRKPCAGQYGILVKMAERGRRTGVELRDLQKAVEQTGWLLAAAKNDRDISFYDPLCPDCGLEVLAHLLDQAKKQGSAKGGIEFLESEIRRLTAAQEAMKAQASEVQVES